jgi:hypothetical protein
MRGFSFFLGSFWLLLLTNCTKLEPVFNNGMGKKPIYLPENELKIIENKPPQPIQVSGTIFLKDTLFFILEQQKGIHVFNIKDTANTINLAFFNIPAITDFTISGNVLYADSWRDLVAIDIQNLQDVKEINRIENVLNPVLYPLFYNGIFECVDAQKGAVVGWEDADLVNAKCVTIN